MFKVYNKLGKIVKLFYLVYKVAYKYLYLLIT
jgi:hypothetical protein